MSLIACTDPCIYQSDGYCTLSRAVSAGCPSEDLSCVHFLPRHGGPLQEHRQRLSDVSHLNEP